MTPKEYLTKQEGDRKEVMTAIHNTMVKVNKTVTPEVDKMMGQEMIQYKIGRIFMYGLGNGKGHMSLHLLPMYGCAPIHDKYKKLLNKAKFQKGCINFTSAEQMPINVVEGLIRDCAKAQEAVIEQYKLRHKK